MSDSRNYFLDNAKFILICLVVFGHALEGIKIQGIEYVYKFIYLFHMPCFVFILGYFSKNIKTERIVYNFLLYIIFQTSYCIFNILVLDKKFSSFGYTKPVWILWFMLAAAVWQLLFYKLKGKKELILISIIVALVAGYLKFIGYGLSLSRIIVFAPFFLIGYYIPKDFFAKIKRVTIIPALVVICCVTIVIVAFNPFEKGLLYGSMAYSKLGLIEWYAFIHRLLYYVLSLALSVSFFTLVPKKEYWFTSLGTRTLQVYFFHGLVIQYTKHAGLPNAITSYFDLLVYLLATAIVILVLASKPAKETFDSLLNPLSNLAVKIQYKIDFRS